MRKPHEWSGLTSTLVATARAYTRSVADDARPAGRDTRDALLVGAAALALLLVSVPCREPGGKALVGGLRVLDGDVPYRDFWTMYAPGQFYVAAALLGVFGRHALVPAVAAVVLVAATAALLFALARRLGARTSSGVLLAATLVLASFTARPELSSYEPALLAIVLGLHALLTWFRTGSRRALVAAGLALGAAACCKHDVAFHAALAFTAALLAHAAATREGLRQAATGTVRALGGLAGGCALVVVPVAVLVAASAGRDAWQDLFVFPARVFPLVMREAFPGLLPNPAPLERWRAAPGDARAAIAALGAIGNWAACRLPLVVALGALATWRLRSERTPARGAFVALAAVAVPLFFASAHVQQNTHPVSMLVFAALGVAALDVPARAERRAAPRLVTAALALCALAGAGRQAPAIAEVALLWREGVVVDHGPARGVRTHAVWHATLVPTADWIDAHVPPDEPIYVGAARHDAIVASKMVLYALAERRPATRWHELHPGVADSETVQQAIVEELERGPVRCVVLWRFGLPAARQDELVAKRRAAVAGLGATRLDAYIREHYRVVASHGELDICWRRDAEPPAPWSPAPR